VCLLSNWPTVPDRTIFNSLFCETSKVNAASTTDAKLRHLHWHQSNFWAYNAGCISTSAFHLPSRRSRLRAHIKHELSVYFTKKGGKESLLNVVADRLVFLSQNREILVSDLEQKTDNPNNLSWPSTDLPDNCCDPILQTITIPSFHILSNP
jgi:hypothetical protein